MRKGRGFVILPKLQVYDDHRNGFCLQITDSLNNLVGHSVIADLLLGWNPSSFDIR